MQDRGMYVLIVITVIFSKRCLSESNLPECSHRFEGIGGILEANPEYGNCTYVKERYPICAGSITVKYTVQPPYVVLPENGSTTPIGLLPDALLLILRTCCFNCKEVIFKGPVSFLEKYKPMSADIIMPVQSSTESTHFDGKQFISILKASKVSVLAKQNTEWEKSHELTMHMVASVLATWPLFCIAILMAITSGCVLWTLDTWFNEEHFPRRFPRGIFEGFWWAFVTMTTVGYGDRVPTSFISKIFSILWIFLGITLFNMYTAILTTALDVEPEIFDTKDFYNKNVGILHSSSAGRTVVLQEHGNLILFNTIDELAIALENDKVKGIALDANVARYYMRYLKRIVPLIKRHHMVSEMGNVYGILSKHSNLSNFLKGYIKTNIDVRLGFVSYALYSRWPHLKHVDDIDKVKVKVKFFDSQSPMFKFAIIFLIISSLVFIFIGQGFRLLFHKRNDVMTRFLDLTKTKVDCCSSLKIVPEDIEVDDNSKIVANCIRALDELKKKLNSIKCGNEKEKGNIVVVEEGTNEVSSTKFTT